MKKRVLDVAWGVLVAAVLTALFFPLPGCGGPAVRESRTPACSCSCDCCAACKDKKGDCPCDHCRCCKGCPGKSQKE